MTSRNDRAGQRTGVLVVLAVVASAVLVAVAPSAEALIVPRMPRNVHADVFDFHAADVYWTPGDGTATSFKVEARNATTLSLLATASCTAPCGGLHIDGLPSSTRMVFWVYGRNALGPGLPGRSVAVTTPAANTPDPVTGLTAVASVTEPTVTVRWTMAATGNPATKVRVVALRGDTEVASSVCSTPCTSSVALGLTPGGSYRFAAVAGNANGSGVSSGPSAEVTVADGACGEGQPYCLTVDGTTAGAGARGLAQGLLHSANRFGDVSRLTSLGVTSWRLSIGQSSMDESLNVTAYENAVRAASVRGTRPITTLIISDAWYGYTESCTLLQILDCGAQTPWSDWGAYDAFVRGYVSAVVAKLTADGVALPDYWEIQNEPDELPTSDAYFRAGDRPSATIPNVQALFLHGYRAIKEVLPTAKVMGPSIAMFAAQPGARDPGTIDLSTFLDFSDANGLVWDAIAWHENAPKVATDWTTDPEEVIVNHTDTARALIAAHPAQGSPKLVVNEYGPKDRWVVPGWQAGAIAGFEAAGVDFASHACFSSANHAAPGHNCFDEPSTLNGLLATNGGSPYAGWWVHDFYSRMSFDPTSRTATTSVRSTSSHPSVGVFATRDDANHAVYALVGRHATCRQDLNEDCTGTTTVPAPANIPLTLTFPYAAPNGVQVTVRRIPVTAGDAILGAPLNVDPVLSYAGSTVTITLPAVADGDAFTVIVSPRP